MRKLLQNKLIPRLGEEKKKFNYWDKESLFENVLLQIYPSHYFVKAQYMRVFD